MVTSEPGSGAVRFNHRPCAALLSETSLIVWGLPSKARVTVQSCLGSLQSACSMTRDEQHL